MHATASAIPIEFSNSPVSLPQRFLWNVPTDFPPGPTCNPIDGGRILDSRLKHDLETHETHTRQLAQAVMHRQLKLSVKIAAVFIIMLVGLPLVNYKFPEFANRPVWGFTLTWLFLAVLFYPVTWVLSWIFIRESNRLESDIAGSLRHQGVSPDKQETR